MKKQLLKVLLCSLMLMPFMGVFAEDNTVADKGQTTEGKDFWVTYLMADQGSNDLFLQLSISSRTDCHVTITHPFTSFRKELDIEANKADTVTIYHGSSPKANSVRIDQKSKGNVCYAVNSEVVDTCAIHIEATEDISLFATNFKYATFDATNVLPTPSLLDEYYIQTYTPSDNEGANKSQGSHFAIIAVDDSVVVDITPSVATMKHPANVTFTTDTLMQGQVYYVLSSDKDDKSADLSGTHVVARDGKKIAVYQGCPHTSIPYQVEQRDHIYSQAMPTKYWGNTFAITASKGRPADIIRVMALYDSTTIYINGDSIYTFNFTENPKQYWEGIIGAQGTYAQDSSCFLTTSCPCSVHLFQTSQKYKGGGKGVDGDPSMLWVNPIEQQIDQVTFTTYKSLGKTGTGTDRTTSHYVNVVTDKPELMTLSDRNGSIDLGEFKVVSGSDSAYFYKQFFLGHNVESYTLKSNGSKFIAHVYGFTQNESYGYSAGGATKPMTQYIIIDGKIFTEDSEDQEICRKNNNVGLACHPDYEYEKIVWYFGDDTSAGEEDEKNQLDTVNHLYPQDGTYNGAVHIYRNSSNVCVGQQAVAKIKFRLVIGTQKFSIDTVEVPCPVNDGDPRIGLIYYKNPGHVDLKGENVLIEFDQAAKDKGFDDSQLDVSNPDYFKIVVPQNASPKDKYGIHIKIDSECGGADTIMTFNVPFDNNVIDQRYSNVLGLLNEPFVGMTLSDYQWYRQSDSTAITGQISANLNFYDLPKADNEKYYVCFTINKGQPDEMTQCACAKSFSNNSKTPDFGDDASGLDIEAGGKISIKNNTIFVNADWKGKTDIECFAQWYDFSGHTEDGWKYNVPDGGCTIPTPAKNGFYILRVVTDGASRSFKFFINK